MLEIRLLFAERVRILFKFSNGFSLKHYLNGAIFLNNVSISFKKIASIKLKFIKYEEMKIFLQLEQINLFINIKKKF